MIVLAETFRMFTIHEYRSAAAAVGTSFHMKEHYLASGCGITGLHVSIMENMLIFFLTIDLSQS